MNISEKLKTKTEKQKCIPDSGVLDPVPFTEAKKTNSSHRKTHFTAGDLVSPRSFTQIPTLV